MYSVFMATPIYNEIGKVYNTTRRADPYIADRMYYLLSPQGEGLYLDIGCGTGNYTSELAGRGINFYGIDPSETMLTQARNKDSNIVFIQGRVEALPFADNFFSGAIAMFTFHHWEHKLAGLKELNRVQKPGARLVFLTFAGEQMRGYWLNEYFPKMMKRSWELVPELPEMEQLLNEGGFKLVGTEKYFVQDDLQDQFLYANKSRPEQYLRPEIRQNASSFSAFCEPEELQQGLQMLEADINSGKIADVMKRYENDKGDYMFLDAQKG